MIRRLLSFAAALALALTAVACGNAGPTPSGSASPDAEPPVQALDLRYTCGEFSFGLGLLSGPAGAEQAGNPAAAALRAHLATSNPQPDDLPDTGWLLAGMDERVAEFLAIGPDQELMMVSVENRLNGWEVADYGQCRPSVDLAEGLVVAEWTLDPAQPAPGPATQTFEALVTEQSCNSGQPADGRIVGPEIVKSEGMLLVIFATRPRPGGQDCQGNPSTRTTVDLGEPLGNRRLLDGGRFPPADPAKPPF